MYPLWFMQVLLAVLTGEYFRTRPDMAQRGLLNFFIIPPDRTVIKKRNDTLRLRVKCVVDPSPAQLPYFRTGKLYLSGTSVAAPTFTVLPPPYPINARLEQRSAGVLYIPVDKTMKYDPAGAYQFFCARLDEDLIGEEIEVYGEWQVGEPPIPEQYGYPWTPPGIWDLDPTLSLMACSGDIPTEPGSQYANFHKFIQSNIGPIGISPVYAAINAVAYVLTRDEVRRLVDERGPINVDQLILSAIGQLKTLIKMPDMKYRDSIIPPSMAAGEPFSISHNFYNQGGPGPVELQIITDSKEEVKQFTADGIFSLPQSFDAMPWDDFSLSSLMKLRSPAPVRIKMTNLNLEGYNYQPNEFPVLTTDTKRLTSLISAGFPAAALGDVDAPDGAKPGDRIRVAFPVINAGYKGDVGLRVISPNSQRDIMQRIESGGAITPTFETEMPATEAYSITVIPIHLGRNKATVLGAEKAIEIKPINVLFHLDKEIKILGGYESNEIQGFVAGKNVRVSGLSTTVGTGGLPFLSYNGYILSGSLGPGAVASIEYDELYYLKIDVGKEIATARRGALIERATKTYEYSQIPTPAMTAHTFKSLGSLLTKTATRLEMG